MSEAALLQVSQLTTRFGTGPATVQAVDQISFTVARGETLGVVGESGSGKSQTLFSILGLLPPSASLSGSVKFEGEELIGASQAKLRAMRGMRMAMVFQDPMTALNPYLTLERQLTEVLTYHRGISRKEARGEALQALRRVHIPEAERQLSRYPHQLSGGMRQRVVIAMAMLGKPALLLADEPTTALDVTIQSEILDLLGEQQKITGVSIILVTHDLGVVARLCDRVLVMYAGRIVEQGEAMAVFKSPCHPYTQALLRAIPRLDDDHAVQRGAIGGQPPSLSDLPPGCAFAPRCSFVHERCLAGRPPLYETSVGSLAACYLEAGSAQQETTSILRSVQS